MVLSLIWEGLRGGFFLFVMAFFAASFASLAADFSTAASLNRSSVVPILKWKDSLKFCVAISSSLSYFCCFSSHEGAGSNLVNLPLFLPSYFSKEQMASLLFFWASSLVIFLAEYDLDEYRRSLHALLSSALAFLIRDADSWIRLMESEISPSLTSKSSSVSVLKLGLWFTSISQGLHLLSSMTSRPKISKQDRPSLSIGNADW